MHRMSTSDEPQHDSESALWRVIDASINRGCEGLRVIEDFVRFGLDDAHLTSLVKDLRHELAATCAALPLPVRLAARDTQQDVGAQISTAAETRRSDAWEVCVASLQRAKQSLRSLEEFSKIPSPQVSAKFESLRYRLYTVERAVGITQHSAAQLKDAQLCVLVDGRSNAAAFATLVQQLVAAGVSMIQLRDKRLGSALLVERARLLCELAARASAANSSPSPSLRGRGNGSRTLVIINDRPDIAAAVNADGVHLGQDDMRVKDARAVVGPRRLIGVSTHSIEQARAAVLDGANYLGVGPTFPSTTKSFGTFPGLDFLRQVAAEIRLPALAIGGIRRDNLHEVLATGIGRVAVGSAVVGALDPAEAARQLIDVLQRNAAEPSASADG